jgi:uncharacterized RmlC-like cupin family protein
MASAGRSQQMWMGFAVLEPGGKTGVHHHGKSETAIYNLSGVTRWWTIGPHPQVTVMSLG